MNVKDRFLSYIAYPTTSDESSATCPSTPCQKIFAAALTEELRTLGLAQAEMDENGYVYGFLPASHSCEEQETLGLIAHMDTAPTVSGQNIRPRCLHYQGGDIRLENGESICTAEFPWMTRYIGQELIVTDGTTLLGSDDKAGIAEIVTTCEFLLQHPEIPHRAIAICFTPDEKINRGTDRFDFSKFRAETAYTVDSGDLGLIEYECFNAASATAEIRGFNLHSGAAKGRMKNAVLLAAELVGMLPGAETPAHTEGYEGFYHVTKLNADVSNATLQIAIRDHDREKFEGRKAFLQRAADYLNRVYGEGTCALFMEDNYYKLEHVKPEGVFRWFEALCAIPHGSGNTKAVADWCVAFAQERHLRCYRDAADNVIIIKEASPGYEDAPTLILQGHLDMVCEKTESCTRDMEKEALDLRCDGEWVWAEGTTLGGDDGIAVAMALGILDADDLPHPRLEVLLTSDEEVGMLGAQALDASVLQGRRMLNIDHSEELSLTAGCAGGNRTVCTVPVQREAFDGAVWHIKVSGLRGGHSGGYINQGRGNAPILLGRMLEELSLRTDLRLITARGGLKDNAIPVAAEAWIAVSPEADIKKWCEEYAAVLKKEYQAADPGMTWEMAPDASEELPMDGDSTARCLCLLTCAPNGVQEMSQELPGFPQTSLNLGILTTSAEALQATFCLRSSMASQKEMMCRRLHALAAQLGGVTEIHGNYPAWKFRPDSPLRELVLSVYREQNGKTPVVRITHGGLECGILSEKLPGLDCVSIGPNMPDIHTPRERMEVASVQRVWNLALEILRRSC